MVSHLVHLEQQLLEAEWVITVHSLHTEGPKIVIEVPLK